MQRKASALFGGGNPGLDGRLLALDVGLAAFFVLGFVVLLSHIVFTLFAVCDFVSVTMSFYTRGFNLYLLLAATMLAAASGCQTDKGDKHLAALRIHLETRAQMPGSGKTVSVIRADPVRITINTDPVLTEASVIGATLLNTPVGYAVEVKFDEMGAYTLEQYTSVYQGRHFVIWGQWSNDATNSRWLAAPIITRRIANGVLAFTPDASLEESRQLVLGLNNVAKKIAKGKIAKDTTK